MTLATLRSSARRHAGVACLVVCAANWVWSHAAGGWGITLASVEIVSERFAHVGSTHACSSRSVKGVYSEDGVLYFAGLTRDGGVKCASSLRVLHHPEQVKQVVHGGPAFEAGGPREGGHFVAATASGRSGRFAPAVPALWNSSHGGLADRGAAVPWWLLTAAFAFAPARRVLPSLLRRVRVVVAYPPGTCRACGYDLRATPAAGGPLLGRCPECGSPAGPAGGPALASVARPG